MIQLSLQDLRKSLNVKETNGKLTLKHTINKKATFFPFQTRNPERAKFKEGFAPVLGQLFRNVEHLKEDFELNSDQIIRNISDQVSMEVDDKQHFERILESFLFQSNSLRIFHPMMYKFIPLSESKEKIGEREIAHYLYDSLLNAECEQFKDFLQLQENEHVLARLIHQHMPTLDSETPKPKYANTLPFIQDLFLEDLQTLLSNRDFFMNHISLFMAYYYFYSVTQQTLKLNHFEKAEIQEATPIFYNLDWEASNRNRPAVTTGFKLIMDNARKLLSHVNTLEHLNFIMDTENLTYKELDDHFVSLNEERQEEVLQDLYTWTVEYSEIVIGKQEDIMKHNDFPEGIRQLYNQLSQGISLETKYRYSLAIHEIGKLHFLKTRGSLGNTLNISQDFLMLLTGVSVKHEKISLKQLFREYEKRGVFFDRYSKDEIIELFNKINLIEKKSDSGDAQYVKPIL